MTTSSFGKLQYFHFREIELCHFRENERYHFWEIEISHFRKNAILLFWGDWNVLFLGDWNVSLLGDWNVSFSRDWNVIFWALAHLVPVAYLKLCETLIRHIQNPVLGHYSAIFRHIQNLVQRLHVQKPDILEILEYAEPLHNCIPTRIQNPVILAKIYEYSELWHI